LLRQSSVKLNFSKVLVATAFVFIQSKVGFGQTNVVSMTFSTKELIASKTLLFFNA